MRLFLPRSKILVANPIISVISSNTRDFKDNEIDAVFQKPNVIKLRIDTEKLKLSCKIIFMQLEGYLNHMLYVAVCNLGSVVCSVVLYLSDRL